MIHADAWRRLEGCIKGILRDEDLYDDELRTYHKVLVLMRNELDRAHDERVKLEDGYMKHPVVLEMRAGLRNCMLENGICISRLQRKLMIGYNRAATLLGVIHEM